MLYMNAKSLPTVIMLRSSSFPSCFQKADRYKTALLISLVFVLSAQTTILAFEPHILTAVARLDAESIKEPSGITKSRHYDDLYWLLSDSGNDPRVYPVTRHGELYHGSKGVLINGAQNIDWEDLAINNQGQLLIADFGNNYNDRQDMVIYVIDEPSPQAKTVELKHKWYFEFPDQTAYPAPQHDFNFDAEALFTVDEDIFVLSKNVSDTNTKLYRLKNPQGNMVNRLEYLGKYDVKGQATGADTSVNGKKLAITTYQRIWLFERQDNNTHFFASKVSSYRFIANQVEAICFIDNDSLMLVDEKELEFYEVKTSKFTLPTQPI